MQDNSVGTSEIVNLSVTQGKLATTPAAVGTSQMVDNAVNADKLADNAVDTAAIQNLAVTQGKLATSPAAVGTSQIANLAVTEAKLSTSPAAVNTNQIVNNAITTTKILNSNVTSEKLSLTNSSWYGAGTLPSGTWSALHSRTIGAGKWLLIWSVQLRSGNLPNGYQLFRFASGFTAYYETPAPGLLMGALDHIGGSFALVVDLAASTAVQVQGYTTSTSNKPTYNANVCCLKVG